MVMFAVVFCVIWAFIARNRWYWWSVCGSTALIMSTYFGVQISVWLNTWYGSFYDLIQRALTKPNSVELSEFYGQLATAAYVLVPYIVFLVLLDFFTSHYLFRWRKAMNGYYMSYWPARAVALHNVSRRTPTNLRASWNAGIEFRAICHDAYDLPLLWTLSGKITEYPLVGNFTRTRVSGHHFRRARHGRTAAVGFKLPGLEFENQKVEAAYREELVYGEDDEHRADPETARALFDVVRGFYYRYYFHLYFNVARYAYLQGSAFIPFVALGPTIVAGVITFGVFQQIMNALNQVENTFQFLANSWTRIVELLSIHKRLRAFEKNIGKAPVGYEPITGWT